jgi:hypothetical protein
MLCSVWYRLFSNPDLSIDILYLNVERRTVVLLCAHLSAQCLAYPMWKTKTCCRSCSWWGNTYVMYCFGCKCCQDIMNELLLQCDTYISHNARPTIGDAPMQLIFRMSQGVCCQCYFPSRWPISHCWMFATNRKLDYMKPRTKNRPLSIDAHFWNGVGSVLLLMLPLKTANTVFLDGHKLSPLWLPKMQSQKSLTLPWWSFSEWGSDHPISYFAYTRSQCIGYA